MAHESIHHRPCIYCGVDVGERCVTRTGKVAGETHQVRRMHWIAGHDDKSYQVTYDHYKRKGGTSTWRKKANQLN